MHRVPPERQNRRVLEADKVCDAVGALVDSAGLRVWADRFNLLRDPSRLALLVAMAEAGPISVTDLAVATNLHDTTVSQALRYLRAAGVVLAHRDGRVMRYELGDASIRQLVGQVTGPRDRHPHAVGH
jgi:ArsR family transcriptional regulator, lead/cadmium/zinc/bismuth-responsive transcriptional repressor